MNLATMKHTSKLSHRSKDSGFTLIELLVVIVIIGILASIAVIGVGAARKTASISSCSANATQTIKALIEYDIANLGVPLGGANFVGTYNYNTTPAISTLWGATTYIVDPILNFDTATTGRAYYLKAWRSSAGVYSVAGFSDTALTIPLPGGCAASSG